MTNSSTSRANPRSRVRGAASASRSRRKIFAPVWVSVMVSPSRLRFVRCMSRDVALRLPLASTEDSGCVLSAAMMSESDARAEPRYSLRCTGSMSPSESMNPTQCARACEKPDIRAPPLPWFTRGRRRCTCGLSRSVTASWLSSEPPSSTAMTS